MHSYEGNGRNLRFKRKSIIIRAIEGEPYVSAVPVEENFRKDVSVMCNLSQGVKEYGMMEEKVKVILKMHQKNYTTAEISDIVDIPEDEVQRLIEEQSAAVS